MHERRHQRKITQKVFDACRLKQTLASAKNGFSEKQKLMFRSYQTVFTTY